MGSKQEGISSGNSLASLAWLATLTSSVRFSSSMHRTDQCVHNSRFAHCNVTNYNATIHTINITAIASAPLHNLN